MLPLFLTRNTRKKKVAHTVHFWPLNFPAGWDSKNGATKFVWQLFLVADGVLKVSGVRRVQDGY